MSGFAGILNLDGVPADPILLERMARALSFRGPDAQGIWCDGPVGLGHALLRATREAPTDAQPVHLERRLWIVADARIDARAELVDKINTRRRDGRKLSIFNPDQDLILNAYNLWGDACLEHLLGDFSFAIWDSFRKRLFCARDHFGIKPFYYAQIANAVAFSNALDTLWLHPNFAPTLCDAAIADYLLLGINLHVTLTPFEQVLRLPPAHTLTISGGQVRVQRYWSLPIEEPARFRRSRDCIEEFQQHLSAAVGDRLRTDRASVSLSGGLDAPSMAAIAAEQLGSPEKLLGITHGYKRVALDPEPPLARIIADYLGIPWHFTAIDDYKPFERRESPSLYFPWPSDITLAAPMCDFMEMVASHGRVLLTGQGGDPGLAPSLVSYRGARVFNLAGDVGKYFLTHGRHPRIGFRVTWQRQRGIHPKRIPEYPTWLYPGLETRLGLRDRWQELMRDAQPVHPFRPDAYNSLIGTHWPSVFETYDASSSHVAVETRHPLFDLRMQRFLLRLPVLPWCADKDLLRRAMRGRLPEEILRRPKTPVPGNPTKALLQDNDMDILNRFEPNPELARYVVRDKIPVFGRNLDIKDPVIDLRPVNLNYWMGYVCRSSSKNLERSVPK